MLASPYAPGELPRVLVGRKAEQARIRGQLDRVAALGEMPPMLVVHAPRGLGKTSLLRELETQARESAFITSWLSCAKGASLISELAHAVRRALEEGDVLDASGRRTWRATVDRLGVELGVPGAKVTADVGIHHRDGAPPSGLIGVVQDLLHDAAGAVRRRGGSGLLVLVDELHAAPFPELAVVLNALQNLSGARSDNPLAVLAAGLPSTPEVMTRAATFGERSEFVSLDRFDEVDSALALVEPAATLDVGWDQDALRAAIAFADGYPYFLQLVGHTTWQAGEPEKGQSLSLADVAAGERLMTDQLNAMYRARWASAPPLEQALMAAMASHGAEVVPRDEIAAHMGRESRAISVPRARLIDRGVIEAAGRGRLRFTLPGMAAWIRAEADE